jgi:hypothetical protein
MLFAKTLDSHGIFVTPLIDFLATSRDKFENVLMRWLHDEVVKIFTSEKYEPLRVKDYHDYQRDVEAFELQGEAMHVEYAPSFFSSCSSVFVGGSSDRYPDCPPSFPTNMPFSSTVPSTCRTLQRFIGITHLPSDM